MSTGPRTLSRPRKAATRSWLLPAAGLLLAAPVAVVLVAGFVWLWDRSWFLWWLVGAAALSAIAWGALRLWERALRASGKIDGEALTEADPTWSPHERAAWEEVQRLSHEADASALTDHRALLATAQQTIEAVSRHYHPEHADPTLEFTVPELLLLTERVSARMRVLLLDHVPYSHRLKAGQLLRVWGYRPLAARVLAHSRTVYSLMRVLRIANPLSAVTAELRDHVVNDIYDTLQSHVRSRIVRLWIEEVGRAAIDLYSGRLRIDAAALAAAAAAEGLEGTDAAVALPGELRLLVAGQTKAGKSTLVNALLGELAAGVDVLPMTAGFQAYELVDDGAPAACLIDSPGIDSDARVDELVNRAFACDLVLWVVPAHRADRRLDRRALDTLRARFGENPQRKMPPVVVVASHVDRLSPPREWSPPYNVEAPEGPKARSMRAALESIAQDLDVAVEAIVPVRLDTSEPYNLEMLRMRLAELFDEAKRARWIRIQRTAPERGDWRRALKQLTSAGRVVGKLVRSSES